jgi:hypothetical protein
MTVRRLAVNFPTTVDYDSQAWWDATDAAAAAQVANWELAAKLRADYYALVARLERIEAERGRAYLVDHNVTHENVIVADDIHHADYESDPVYWHLMITAAGSEAGFRAEEQGFQINDYFDKPIY